MQTPFCPKHGHSPQSAAGKLLRQLALVALLSYAVRTECAAAKDLKALADLPSREQIRSQIVGAVQGPLAQLVSLLQAPLREIAYVLEARGKDAAEQVSDTVSSTDVATTHGGG